MRHCPGDRRRVWACSSETAEGAAACLHRLGGRPRRGRFSEATHCGWRFGIPIAAPDSQPGQRAVVSARICPLPRSRPIHWAPAECVAAPQTGGRGGLCFLSSNALSVVPAHEVGSRDAVLALLQLRDQFVFLGAVVKRFLDGPWKDQDLKTIIDSCGDDVKMRRSVIEQNQKIQVSNVRLHLDAIFLHYQKLSIALGAGAVV